MLRVLKTHSQVVAAVLIYCVIRIFGWSDINVSHDSYVGVMDNLLEAGFDGGVDSHFQIPLRFFLFFSGFGVGPDVIGFVLGLGIIFLTFRFQRPAFFFTFCFFLFFPSYFLGLGDPGKEVFLTYFTIFTTWLLGRGRIFWASVVMMVYALGFRIYFVPISVALAFCSIRNTAIKIILAILFILFGLILLAFYSDEVFDVVVGYMSRRDYGYWTDDVRRTVFKNLVEMEGGMDVVVNYFYAFFKINFPILFGFNVKDCVLQVYTIFVITVMVLGVRNRIIIAYSLVVNFLVYPFFEPDYGSYFRHLVSIFPLYIYLLSELNKKRFWRLKNV